MDQHVTGDYRGARTGRLLQRREVEERLGISRRTLWRLTKQGAIPVVRFGGGRLGGHPRYLESDIEAFIRAHRRSGPSP
jgi:excisionase family DNA binding protein